MTSILDFLWHGRRRDALLMAWAVWWALVLGFAISAIVQAWVPRERIERTLGGGGGGPAARATALGAASSSCSYAAMAIARSLFVKGASAASALAFQFASTNLVWELGLVPSGPRPGRADIFGAVHVDYKVVLNVVGAVIFAALWWLTQRRGAHRSGVRDARGPGRGSHALTRSADRPLLLGRMRGGVGPRGRDRERARSARSRAPSLRAAMSPR